jgi:uncharacterized ubiquitin-like protein YukD
MSESVIVTVRIKALPDNNNGEFALPLDVPQYLLIDFLTDAFQISKPERKLGAFVVIRNAQKKRLTIQSTLRESGIQHGQILELLFFDVMAQASLICIPGPEFFLERDEISVGCSNGVEIDLRSMPNQLYVSGKHAKVSKKNGFFYLQDLQSKNGTSINTNRIEPMKPYLLTDQDKILLGADEYQGITLVFKEYKER